MRFKRAFSFDTTIVKGAFIRRFSWAFGVFAIVVSFSFAYIEFQRHSEQQHKQVKQMALQLAEEFDHQLQQYQYAVETLQASANQAIEGRITLAYKSVDYLYRVNTHHGYSLKVPSQEYPEVVGNLTGLGNIPPPNSPMAREMDMALTLSPLFAKLVKLSPNIPWVYYTSANHFVYLYPRVPPNEYFYQESLHEKPFYTGALPVNNPLHRTFWTPTYLDEGGKGLMVTVSKPIYDNETFIGSVSVDVGLDTLSWILNHNTLPNTTAYLVNKEGYPIASPKHHPVSYLQKLVKQDSTSDQVDDVEQFALQTNDWRVVLVTPKSIMEQEALKNSTLYAMIVFLVLICVFLIVWLSQLFYQVHAMSMRDFLTGLYNRRSFEEVGEQEFARARRSQEFIGLALIDVDYFKKYNDHYGHQAGDKVLQHLGEFFSQRVSRVSDKVFRIGGEEFVILVHVKSSAEFESWIQRLCLQLRNLEIEHLGSPVGCLTISIGATIIGGSHWVTLEQAVSTADMALYKAKNEGRNRVEIDWPEGVAPNRDKAPILRAIKS